MKFTQAIKVLLAIEMAATMVPKAMGRRLGARDNKGDDKGDDQAARRKLATSRYLKANDDAIKIPEEYTIEFVDGKEADGRDIVDELLKQHKQSKKLFDYTSALQAVTIVGVPEEDMMDFLVNNLDVLAIVEEDTLVEAVTVSSWGLDRIDQESLPLDNDYSPPDGLDGSDVDIYILDTGVDTTHSEFSGRIVNGADFTNENLPGQDPHGHGTHVAGTAAGSTYGVANKANIIPVRVLSSSGSGYKSWSTAGIDWVVQQAASTGRRSVINMSLGGSISSIQNDAIRNAVNAGVVVAVAAGNDNVDACTQGPANSPEAITVASSTSTDGRSWFSNYGSCVDIFAPGSFIPSARTGGGSTSKSGTSMAAPHVAGAAALLLQANPEASASDIGSEMVQSALDGKISDAKGSPNKLLFVSPYSSSNMVQSEWSNYVNDMDEFFSSEFNAPSGQTAAICGVSSYHSDSTEDRRFRFKYCYPKDSSVQGTTIAASSDWSEWDKFSNYNCPEDSFISRVTSIHDDDKEDRRFQYNCHRFDEYSLGSCHTTDWVNSFDGVFEYAADDGYVISGFQSSHSNSYEDRVFKFRVCRVNDGSSTCVDTHGSCGFWAGIGECSKNPGWMLPNCAKSCGQC